MKRRSFLKGLAAVPLLSSVTAKNLLADSLNTGLVKNGEVFTAAHWGMLNVQVKDGKVIGSKPYQKTSDVYNPLQYYTHDLVYKSRIKYPMVRKSYLQNPDSPKPELRGKDEWVRVRYEDAIKLVARELKKTRAAKGLESVFAGSYGWKSSGNVHNSRILLHRFMNLSGGFVGSLGDYSTGASQIIMPHVLGTIEVYEQQTSWPVVLESSEVVVIWGANPLATLRIAWTSTDEQGFMYFEKLRDSGKKIIIIDPLKTETAEFFKDAMWVTPRPNTDTAMMLGMAHHLYTSGKYDKEFMANYTHGFEKFLPYLLGKTDKTPKDAKWASKISGVSEKMIKELAELFFAKRTMFMSGWGMQRAHHGEQPHWMLVTLCSMLGQIGLPGGGFGLSYHYSNGGAPTCKGAVIGGVNSASVGKFNEKGEFIGTDSGEFDKNGRFVAKAVATAGTGQSWLQKATNYAFPVARIADALLNPGKVINHNGTKITYPDIDFIYWVGGNPFVHHQELNRLVKAWQKPRTIVVNEPYWTPTAKMADIVFPVTTEYERNDITMTGDYSNMNIAPMKQVVEKFAEAKDDYQVFTDLCKAYDERLAIAFTDNGKSEFDWIREYYEAALNQVSQIPDFVNPMKPFDEFWSENKPVTFSSTPESDGWVRYAEFREDPILNALGTPSGLIEIYSETIEKMGYEDCKPHPMWYEPIEWLGMKDKPAKFHMISAHPTDRLHSQFSNTTLRDKYAVANREPIWINEEDAKELGVKDGDLVRVFNKRGEVVAGAKVTKNILKGVVKLAEGVWYDPSESGLCKNGCPNVLTIDIPTSQLANGNISHTALVNIEKFKGVAPELSAFSDPKMS
ncbi:molybdopterin-dependent oxidoreductase [Campylobacter gastrosuis]|uniref:Molybdopterin-dependent oxidoreductase n=1 Tax=Campylobacter gastrosuis TaxID=2974576 RepID=A0ABT7HRP9_9BACT|nr:molybdopterin-dependent oxidoreductase [Campylobacter gastrosuis]MDL0089074.1 molybdopterin-dependent oxidoreductase [Campylobacter gastrosuis]